MENGITFKRFTEIRREWGHTQAEFAQILVNFILKRIGNLTKTTLVHGNHFLNINKNRLNNHLKATYGI